MQEITSTPDTITTYLKKIWVHRYMILVLAKRDLKIKYAQTIIGVTWTLVYPATAVIIYTVFFSSVLNIKAQYPYSLFVLSGVLCWGIFSYIFNQAGPSLLNYSDMVKKMQFPKIIIPLSKCILALVEFAISFVFFIALLFIFNIPFSWQWILFPLAIIPVFLFATGSALLLSGGTIKKRDLFHVIPFIVNFSIWFTPVFYPVNIIPDKYQAVLNLNPISSSINLLRHIFFNDPLNLFSFVGLVIALLIFIIGIGYFKSIEEKINDTI